MIKMLMGFTSQRRQSLLPWDLFCQTKEEKDKKRHPGGGGLVVLSNRPLVVIISQR